MAETPSTYKELQAIELTKKVKEGFRGSKKYLFIVLVLFTCVGVLEQSQSESLSYMVGYLGQGSQAGDPKFVMQAAYP